MTTLHIEHPITDLDTWLDAFNAVGEIRKQVGSRSEVVRHPAGDTNYIVVDLEFDTVEQAESFLGFLRTQIWGVPENSPALAGTPEARILEAVDTTQPAS